MRRTALFVALLAALFVFAFTLPNLRQAQGPFVTRADGPGPATATNFTAELTGDPVAAGVVLADAGDLVTAPEGEVLLVVPVRVAATSLPVLGITFRAVVDDSDHAPVTFRRIRDSLHLSTLQPEIWLGGTVTFRVSEERLRDAESLALSVQSSRDEQFAEKLLLRVDTAHVEWAEEVTLPRVEYAGVVE